MKSLIRLSSRECTIILRSLVAYKDRSPKQHQKVLDKWQEVVDDVLEGSHEVEVITSDDEERKEGH